ncbi:MAG: NYN domain-containing protein [Sphingobium sp.]
MSIEPRAPRLAVLIDADNASARIASGLFEEIAKIGEASVRRIYGDFSSPRSRSWSEILAKWAINPQHSIAYTVGKNASDIALVIDAMDLLHSGRFDGFCLVSSDSDFTALAARIREQGVDVYGFGEQKTPESFRQACRRFIYTENLLPEAPAPSQPEKPDARPEALTRPPVMAIPLMQRAVRHLDNEDGWVALGNVGKMLSELNSDFDPRTYGFAKLSTLVEKTGAFDIDRTGGGHGVRIRIKAAAPGRVEKEAEAPAPAPDSVKEKPKGRRRSSGTR